MSDRPPDAKTLTPERAIPGSARWIVSGASLGVVLIGSPATAILRAAVVERAEAAGLGRPAGSLGPVLLADAPLVGAVLGLALVGFFLPVFSARLRVLVVAARVAAVGLFLVQALDVGLGASLSMRLKLEDVARFWHEGGAGLSLAVGLQRWFGRGVPPTVLGAAVALLLAAWAVAVLSFPFARRTRGRLVGPGAVACLALVSMVALPADGTRFHGWAYPNVVVANLPSPTARPYSPAYLEQASRARHETDVGPGRDLRANVVLYVVESLSSIRAPGSAPSTTSRRSWTRSRSGPSPPRSSMRTASRRTKGCSRSSRAGSRCRRRTPVLGAPSARSSTARRCRGRSLRTATSRSS